MAHATYMAAMNAARKEFGKDWKEHAKCEKVDGQWYVQIIKAAPADLQKDIEVTQQLADIQADADQKAAKKAEIEKKKPAFIPAKPAHEAVASESAPTPKPSLPAFLKPAHKAEEEVPEEAKMGDQAANLASVNVDPLRPRLSSCELPTKKVWHIADSMPGAKRKEVIEACVAAGIAYGTARTQYQHWFKTMNDSKATPIAVIGADGKPYIPAK